MTIVGKKPGYKVMKAIDIVDRPWLILVMLALLFLLSGSFVSYTSLEKVKLQKEQDIEEACIHEHGEMVGVHCVFFGLRMDR